MPESVDRRRVSDLVAAGAQLVEVLPRYEYESEHLPSAVNLPLKMLTATAMNTLDRARPVIVYCHDSL